ncbi:MAG: EAL domain-containing protein [Rhizobiaceae bacterium]|nr:EAL domain-containing protein [Rhizobiaceae bacterium]
MANIPTSAHRPTLVDDAIFQINDSNFLGKYMEYNLKSVFQPIYKIHDRQAELVGYEALIRVFDSEKNVIPPDFFASVQPEDRFFVDWLCRTIHLQNFAAGNHSGKQIFVNLTPTSFKSFAESDPEVAIFADKISELGLHPSQVVCEITEHPVDSLELLTVISKRFQESGIRIAIDDFGVGHSNLERVNALQADIVKLDRLWCLEMRQTLATDQLARDMISQFSQMGIDIVYEGVETEADIAFAMDTPIGYLQGFYLGRPEANTNAAEVISLDHIPQMARQLSA